MSCVKPFTRADNRAEIVSYFDLYDNQPESSGGQNLFVFFLKKKAALVQLFLVIEKEL